MKTVLTAREKLVDVNLVTDIPNKFIVRSGEDAVQRQGELNHAKIRPEMATVDSELGDEFVADLLGKAAKLRHCQLLHVRRIIHHVQVSTHNILSVKMRANTTRKGVSGSQIDFSLVMRRQKPRRTASRQTAHWPCVRVAEF